MGPNTLIHPSPHPITHDQDTYVTVVVSAIRARARMNNIKANSVILRLLFSFSFHLKRREIKLRCRSNMPQPDSQRIILISNELQNIYLELFQIEFQ